MTPPNIPLNKTGAINIIETHADRGQFAISPVGVPSVLWKDAARDISHKHHVTLESRVDSKTDQCIVRLNRGFPLSIAPFTDEAKEWMATQPSWREEQKVWNDTMRSRC